MLSEQQQQLVRDIRDGKLRTLRDIVLKSAIHIDTISADQIQLHYLTYAVPQPGNTASRYSLDLDENFDLAQSLIEFRALIHHLVTLDLVVITGDGTRYNVLYNHIQQPLSASRDLKCWRALLATNYLTQPSPSLTGEYKQHDDEVYVALPALSTFIDSGYRTRDQIEFERLEERAVGAERQARIASWIVWVLSILSLVVSLTQLCLNTTINTDQDQPIHVQIESHP